MSQISEAETSGHSETPFSYVQVIAHDSLLRPFGRVLRSGVWERVPALVCFLFHDEPVYVNLCLEIFSFKLKNLFPQIKQSYFGTYKLDAIVRDSLSIFYPLSIFRNFGN